ncbi:DNA binding protein [[Candida] boidinii]|nr:DNA binding protein [[Candida] boidinii]
MTSAIKENSTTKSTSDKDIINKDTVNPNNISKIEKTTIVKTVTVTTSGNSASIENLGKETQATDISEGQQQSDKTISSSSSTKLLSIKSAIESTSALEVAESQTEQKVIISSDSNMKEPSTASADEASKTKQEDQAIPNTEKSTAKTGEHEIKDKPSSTKEDLKSEMKQDATPRFPPSSNLSSATNSSESIPTTGNIDSNTEDHETPAPADNHTCNETSSTNGATLPVSTTTSSTTQTGTNSPTSKKPANQSASFIHKLYAMLEDPALKHIIWWHTNETSFFVSPCEEFSKVLSTYFKHANVASFIRQLNMYGFHKVNDSNTGNVTSNANEENNSNANTSEETPKDPVNAAAALTSANLNSGSRSRKGSNSSLNGSTPIWEFRHSSGWFKHGNLNGLNLIKRRTFKNTTTQREVHNVKAPIPSSTSGISASNIPVSSSHQNSNGEFPDYRNDIQTYTPYHFNPMTPNSGNNEYYEGMDPQQQQQQQQQQQIATQQQQQQAQIQGQQSQNLQQQPQAQQQQGQPPQQIQGQQVIQQQPQDQDQVMYDLASSSNYNSPQSYAPDVQSVKSEVKSRMGSAIFQVQQMQQQYPQQLQQGQPQIQDQKLAEMSSKLIDLSRNYDSLQRNYELVNEELKMVNYDCVSLLDLLKDFVSVSQNTPSNEVQEESYSRKKKLISLTGEFDKFKANILQRSAARDMALKQAVHTNLGNGYYNTDVPHFNPHSVFRHNSNSSTGSVQSNINPALNSYRAPSQQISGPNDEVAFSKEIRFNSISSYRSRNLSVMDPLQPVHANVVLTPPQISQVSGPLQIQQYPSHGSISGGMTNGEEQRNEYMISHGGVQSYPPQQQQQQQADHQSIAPQRSGTPAMQSVQQQITSPTSKDGRSGIPNQGGPRVYPQMEGQLNPNLSALRNSHSLSAPSSTGQIPLVNGQVGKGLKSRSSSTTGVNYPPQAPLAVGGRHAGSFAHHLSPGNQQVMSQQASPALEQTTKHHSISTPSALSLKSQPTTPLHQAQQQQQAQQQPTTRSQTPSEDSPDMFDQRKRLSQTNLNSYSFNNPPRSLPLQQEPSRQQVPSIQTLMSSNGINDQSMKHSVSQAPISRHNSSGSLADLDNPAGKSTRPSLPHNASQYFSVHASNSSPVATTSLSQERIQDQQDQQQQEQQHLQSSHDYPDYHREYPKDTEQHASHPVPQQIPQPYRHVTGVSSPSVSASRPSQGSLIPPVGVPSYAVPMTGSNSVSNNSSTSVYSLLNHKREPTIQITSETEKRSRIV